MIQIASQSDYWKYLRVIQSSNKLQLFKNSGYSTEKINKL